MRVTAVTPVDKRKCKVFLEEEDFAFPLKVKQKKILRQNRQRMKKHEGHSGDPCG